MGQITILHVTLGKELNKKIKVSHDYIFLSNDIVIPSPAQSI